MTTYTVTYDTATGDSSATFATFGEALSWAGAVMSPVERIATSVTITREERPS